MNGKRILYVYQHDYPWEVRIEKIASSLVEAGYDITVLCRWNGTTTSEYATDGNVRIKRVGFGKNRRLYEPTSYNPLWRSAINQAVDEFQPDIVIPREILLAESCIASARKRHIPVIMDMAEHYPASMKGWEKYSRSLLMRAAVHWLDVPTHVERKSVAGCDGIITCALENSQRLEREYSYSFDRQCIVHNTPRLDDFAHIQKGIIHDEEHYVFSHFGYITSERNIENLIIGFGKVLNTHRKNSSLYIAGMCDPPIENSIRIAAEQHAHCVRRIGKYASYEVGELYSTSDIGVVPHRLSDTVNNTIPNKVFDNLACGKPMMVSLSPPLKRIVEETQSGIAVDCSTPDSIAEGVRIMLNEDLRTMSMNALLAAQTTYNWSVDAARLIEFIQRYV